MRMWNGWMDEGRGSEGCMKGEEGRDGKKEEEMGQRLLCCSRVFLSYYSMLSMKMVSQDTS